MAEGGLYGIPWPKNNEALFHELLADLCRKGMEAWGSNNYYYSLKYWKMAFNVTRARIKPSLRSNVSEMLERCKQLITESQEQGKFNQYAKSWRAAGALLDDAIVPELYDAWHDAGMFMPRIRPIKGLGDMGKSMGMGKGK